MAQGKSKSGISRTIRAASMTFACVGAPAAIFCVDAAAQTPTPEEAAFQGYEASKASLCAVYGWCGDHPGGQPAPAQRIGYDPCYLAQNAMRPCTSGDLKAAEPKGVDPNLAGTWELPFKAGPWVLQIAGDGTYKFHSEAKDGVAANAGSFAASNGHWSLHAKTGYKAAGDYLYQAPDVFIATAQGGAVAWLRPDFAKRAMRPCDAKQLGTSNPARANANVDPNLAGTWELPSKTGGPWVWEIKGDGTYAFHSEAMDMAPPHAGTFSGANYHWSLAAISGLPGYTDTGLYLFQFPNVLMATSERFGGGGAAWLKPASATCAP